jgi:hypothetical protein
MQEQTVIDTTANLASMMERAKIMAGPEYFTCQRTHTRMKKAECIRRQTKGVRLEGSLKKEVPPECKECAQGAEIMAGEKGSKGESLPWRDGTGDKTRSNSMQGSNVKGDTRKPGLGQGVKTKKAIVAASRS